MDLECRPSDTDHMQWLQQLGVTSLQGKRILDLGCGSGYLCHKAMSEGALMAVGIDMEVPANHDPAAAWQFMRRNLDDSHWQVDLKGDAFDLILAFDILEHVESPYRFLRSCREILADQGQLIITTPNIMSWERFLRPRSWSGVTDPQHKTLFSRYSLRHLLSKADLQPVQLRATVRSLAFLGPLQPQVGGQQICVAQAR